MAKANAGPAAIGLSISGASIAGETSICSYESPSSNSCDGFSKSMASSPPIPSACNSIALDCIYFSSFSSFAFLFMYFLNSSSSIPSSNGFITPLASSACNELDFYKELARRAAATITAF